MNHLGELLKYYRLANGMTQSELAADIGISISTISNVEQGIADTPKCIDKIIAWVVGNKYKVIITSKQD